LGAAKNARIKRKLKEYTLPFSQKGSLCMEKNRAQAFEMIYKTYFSRVHTFICRMCGNPDLAEELTQETFYQAFRSFRNFRGDSELFTWLASIAKYTFFAHIRKNRVRNEDLNIDLLTEVLSDSPESDPEEQLQHTVTAEAVKKAIANIPQKYQDVVALRIYADLPFSQIAALLKISENSAKVLFHRAKKMISEELKYENYL